MSSDIAQSLLKEGTYYFRNAVRASEENREAYLDALVRVIGRAAGELGGDAFEVQQLVAMHEDVELWQKMGRLPYTDDS